MTRQERTIATYLSEAEREVLDAAREHTASVHEGQIIALQHHEMGLKVTANHHRTSAAADRLKKALEAMRAEAGGYAAGLDAEDRQTDPVSFPICRHGRSLESSCLACQAEDAL